MYAYSRLLLLLAVALFYAHHHVYCRVSGGGIEVQWQTLSKFNYSSYIRLHPHALLMVTVPSERKKDPVPYEGDIAVSDIINFLAGHGSHVHDLIMDKSYRQVHTSAKGVPQDKILPHEVLVNGRLQNLELKPMNSRFPIGLHERPQLSIGCILSATEKLLDVHSFEESTILLVKVE